LIPTTSDSRIRWFRFDWSVATHRTDPTREEPQRKDAQRGHSKTVDHRNACSSSNQRKGNSLINKPKFQKAAAKPNHTCKDEVALIGDFLAGSLDPTILAAFEKHLNDCPDCTAFLNTYKKTVEATRAFLRSNPVKILASIAEASPQDRRSLITLIFWLHLFMAYVYLTTG
jgi:hypothetical protein